MRSASESQSTRFPQRRPADEGSESEEESSESEDDGEDDGGEKPPVYHHEIWKKLLRKASMGGLLRYGLLLWISAKDRADQITVNQQPETGNDPLDITAVESTQITWDIGDRRFWPRHLTLWNRPAPWKNPTYEVGIMKYKGHVVLDFAGNPIRDFRIPLTVSSKVEGLRMEAWMRCDDRLTLGDIMARLWTKDAPGVGKVPMYDRRALSKRACNARIKAGLVSWMLRRGRDAQTAFMDNLRTPAQRAQNLITDKDLTKHQKGNYEMLGLNENKRSSAPTRENRINKIKRAAGTDDTGVTIAGPSPVGAEDSENDSFTDDQDVDEAVQEPRVRDHVSGDDADDEGSVSSSLIDPLDSRHDQPIDPQEEAALRRALENTVEVFQDLTGQEPVLTNPADNYFSQWSMLQEQFRIQRAANGNVVEAPRLVARDRWTGGIYQYYLAEEIGVADEDEDEDEID